MSESLNILIEHDPRDRHPFRVSSNTDHTPELHNDWQGAADRAHDLVALSFHRFELAQRLNHLAEGIQDAPHLRESILEIASQVHETRKDSREGRRHHHVTLETFDFGRWIEYCAQRGFVFLVKCEGVKDSWTWGTEAPVDPLYTCQLFKFPFKTDEWMISASAPTARGAIEDVMGSSEVELSRLGHTHQGCPEHGWTLGLDETTEGPIIVQPDGVNPGHLPFRVKCECGWIGGRSKQAEEQGFVER